MKSALKPILTTAVLALSAHVAFANGGDDLWKMFGPAITQGFQARANFERSRTSEQRQHDAHLREQACAGYNNHEQKTQCEANWVSPDLAAYVQQHQGGQVASQAVQGAVQTVDKNAIGAAQASTQFHEYYDNGNYLGMVSMFTEESLIKQKAEFIADFKTVSPEQLKNYFIKHGHTPITLAEAEQLPPNEFYYYGVYDKKMADSYRKTVVNPKINVVSAKVIKNGAAAVKVNLTSDNEKPQLIDETWVNENGQWRIVPK